MTTESQVAALPEKWRGESAKNWKCADQAQAQGNWHLAAGFKMAAITETRAADELTAALAQDRAPQAGAPDLTDDLDFEPDEDHTIADMANVGYSLMQAIRMNCPDYCWNESPAEIVVDLINQRDEYAQASQAGAAGAPEDSDNVRGDPSWRHERVGFRGSVDEAMEQAIETMEFIDNKRMVPGSLDETYRSLQEARTRLADLVEAFKTCSEQPGNPSASERFAVAMSLVARGAK